MQFRYENREEFKQWAAPRFGLSSNGMYMFDDDGNVIDGFIWLGRRGDDRDLKLSLNEWIVDGPAGPRRLTTERFNKLYIEVSESE